MSIGKDTFDLNKKDFTAKLSRIIKNHRCNSKIVAIPKEFILRACALTSRWKKLGLDPKTEVYVRNVDISHGIKKVKMICLERGGTRQPVSKSKLIDELYPVKRTAAAATPERKHYNSVRGAMRHAINKQLKGYRDNVSYPLLCPVSGKRLIRGMRTDIDHYGKPFAQIADDFVESQGLTYLDIMLVGPPNAKRFQDKDLQDEWELYHLTHCNLHVVCARANRSKGSDGYTTPPELIGSYDTGDAEEDLSLDF